MADSTIVLASLDDQKLKDSISNLVKNVNDGMDAILNKTNSTVSKMEAKLRSLGKLDIGGSADGGSSNRTQKLKEEKAQIDANTEAIKKKTKAEKELTLTLDQQAQVQQKAARMPSEMRMDAPKSARDSFYVFQSTLTQRSRELVTEIKNAEAAFNTALDIKLQGKQLEWQRKLEQTRQKLEQFRENLGDTRTVQQMREEQRLVNLMSQQQAMLDKIRGQRSQMLQPIMALRAEETKVLSAMHDVEQGQDKVTQSTQQTTQAAKQYTEEIRKQAEEIRKSKQWKETKTYQWTDDKGVTYRVMEGKKLGTIEEQLLAIRNRNLQVEQLQKEIEDSRVVTAQKYASSVREHVANAEKYFEEVKKIKDVQDKTKMNIGSFYGADVTASSQPTAKYVYEINDARAHGLSIEQQVINILQQHYDSERRILELKKEQANVASGTKSQAQTQDVNYLKQQLSSLLNIEEREVAMVNVKEASYKQLSTYLAQLQQAYQKLGGDIAKVEGSDIANEIQRVQRAMATLQTQMKRPVSLGAALGIKTNTLDDIQYKIRQLQSYKQGIDLFKPNAQNEIKQVDEAINKLQKDMNKYMNTSKSVIEQNNALGRSWNYMKNRLAFYFTVGAVTQFVKSLVEVRSQYEMNERALGILIGSAEYGTKVFNELSQMSLISPYTLIELSAAAKQLTAYGVAARDVVDTTRRLADMASAVGVPMERLTYALGQIQAYGYLNSRDQRMFANAGIPLAAELAKYYTEIEGKLVSTGDVYDRIKKKAVDYNDVMQVMYRMTDQGGQFFDFQAKMADTLKVRLANLTLAWNNMLNDIGKEEQGVLHTGIGLLRDMFENWRNIYNIIRDVAIAFGSVKAAQLAYYAAVRASLMFTNKFAARAIALEQVLGVKLAGSIKAVGKSLMTLAASPLTWWTLLGVAITSVVMKLYDVIEKQKEFNRTISEGAKDNYKNITEYMKAAQSLRNSLYDTSEIPQDGKIVQNRPTKNIGNEDAKKAWEEMRNQIEISTSASNEFLQSLMNIEDVNERLRVGFALLDDVQKANAAMKEMNSETLTITQDKSAWWNFYLLPEGAVENVKDYQEALEGAEFSWERFAKGLWRQANLIGTIYNIFSAGADDVEEHHKRMKEDIDKATNSLIEFLKIQGIASNPAGVSEGFAKLYGQFTNGMDAEGAFVVQKEMEEAKANAMRQALDARIADENTALANARDENAKKDIQTRLDVLEAQRKMYAKNLDESRPYWDNFTKFLKERHMSEMQQMFGGMTEEQIKNLNFMEGDYGAWVKRTVEEFKTSHKLSYSEVFNYLRDWVKNANAWSIFIKLTIGTEGEKSLLERLTAGDKIADESVQNIKRLQRALDDIDKRIKKHNAVPLLKRDNEWQKESLKLQKDRLAAVKAISDAEKDKRRAEEEDYAHSKTEDKDAKKAAADAKKRAREAAKAQREAESELQKTLKNELSLIDKLRSSYKALTDEGVSQGRALEIVTSGFGETVKAINDVLVDKWGLAAFDPNKFAGISNPRELVKLLEDQLNALVKTGRAKPIEIQDLQAKVKDLKVDAAKFDTKMVAEGLNNELGKLKDEYELALEFDANPVMGDAFLSALGFDEEGADEFLNSLPHTFEKYAERVQKSISNAITKESESTGAKLSMFSITGGQTVEEWAKENDILETSNLFKEIKQGFDGFKDTLQKNLSDAFKSVDSYVEKYGSLQDKLLLIDKETDSQRRKINDAFYTEELRKTKEYQAAVSATERGAKEKTSKAYWEDFKSSDLYAMTFEDVKNTSTRAIDMILSKLAELKDKVKESPESMKALTKAMEDLEKEKLNRDPFKGVSQSLKDMAAAARETAAAKKELAEADEAVADAQEEVEVGMDVLNMFDGNTHEQTAAQEKLTRAKQRQAEAQKKLTAAENKGKKAQEQLIASLQGISGQLDSVKGLFDVVAELFSAGGDDETAEAIKGINEGFTIMTQVISAVGIALTILESDNPWLLAAAAALSVIVGLVSFLSGSSNEKITEKVEASERVVKRLENTYKNLEYSANNAYGAVTSGAKRATKANKELQLAEAQRQLQLEKSRDEKNRDEDKIIELEGQIIDLKNEINDASKDIVNDLLGISSAGDGIENMVSAMIDAFRNGEDVMKAFGDSFDEMVDNMILKLVVTQFMQKAWDTLLKNMQDKEEQMLKSYSEDQAAAQQRLDSLSELSDDEIRKMVAQEKYGYAFGLNYSGLGKVTQSDIDEYRKAAEEALQASTNALNDASLDYTKWSLDYMNTEGRDYLTQYATLLKDSLGNWYKYGENKEKSLSNLQQGISGITEDTAGALEAITTGMYQQICLQSDLITQIRDAVVGLDLDFQMATQAQMLLQLQNTYLLMQSMHSFMENWTVPSGNGIRVELIS